MEQKKRAHRGHCCFRTDGFPSNIKYSPVFISGKVPNVHWLVFQNTKAEVYNTSIFHVVKADVMC